MKNIINNAIMYGSFTHRKYMSFYCYVIDSMPRQLRNQPNNMAVNFKQCQEKVRKLVDVYEIYMECIIISDIQLDCLWLKFMRQIYMTKKTISCYVTKSRQR